MANTSLLKQKIVEKIGSIFEQKNTFVTLVENFVKEANDQCGVFIADIDDAFLLDKYMDIMKILDQCFNSCVMLTAVADTLKASFCTAMDELLCKKPGSHSMGQNTSITQLPEAPIRKSSFTHVPDSKTSDKTNNNHILLMKKDLPSSSQHQVSEMSYGCRMDVLSRLSESSDTKSVEQDFSQKMTLGNSRPTLADQTEKNAYDVYIGNLASTVVQEDIVQLVKDFHPISTRLRKNKDDPRKVFAFVSFRDSQHAEDCVRTLHNYLHKGRELKVRSAALLSDSALYNKSDSTSSLSMSNKKEEDTWSALASSVITTENDSCYNDLTPDIRGNYSICYSKYMEPRSVSKQTVKEKFVGFGDFSEVHFTENMIFVRFKSKRAAVAALEKYYPQLDLRIAHHGNKKKRIDNSFHRNTIETSQPPNNPIPNVSIFLADV